MNRLSRSTALKIAAVVSLLLGIYGLMATLPYLSQGAATLNQIEDNIPFGVVVAGFTFAILRIIGAYGTWNGQRFGIILTILANAIDGILAIPGIPDAPSIDLQFGAILTAVGAFVVIVLCLWRDHRPATI